MKRYSTNLDMPPYPHEAIATDELSAPLLTDEAPVKKRRGRKPKAEREAEAATSGDPESHYKDAVAAFLKARRQLAKWTAAYHTAEDGMRVAEKKLKGK